LSDKLRTTFPISVTFTEGELPSSAKMNGLARQAKNGLGIIEYVVGDVWNQAGDPIIGSDADAMLMIPSLGRYAGPTRYTNPRIPYLPDIEEYTYVAGLADNGKFWFRLPYPPAGSTTYSWSNGNNAVPEIHLGDVTSAGKWFINVDAGGQIWTYLPLTTGDRLTYKPNIAGDLGAATWNVIPDPDTDSGYGFRGVKLVYKNGLDDSEGYEVYLPPRQPLNTRRINNSPQDLVHSGHSYNISTTPASERLVWQADSVDGETGTNAEHYRYTLPTIVTNNWSSGSNIPAGLVYLWDPYTSETIIDGLAFAAEAAGTPRKWMLMVVGANLSTWIAGAGSTAYPEARLKSPANGGTSDSHAASHYPNDGLRLITVGSDLSSVVSSLQTTLLNHSHAATGSVVNHTILGDVFDKTYWPYFYPSPWMFDDHPQYLHRHGTGMHSGDYRDENHGAMLGDLLMGATSPWAGHNTLVADSFGIIFGEDNNGAKLYFDWSATSLAVELNSSVPSFRIQSNVTGSYMNMAPSHADQAFFFESTGDIYFDSPYKIVHTTADAALGRHETRTPDGSHATLQTGGGISLAYLSHLSLLNPAGNFDNNLAAEPIIDGQNVIFGMMGDGDGNWGGWAEPIGMQVTRVTTRSPERTSEHRIDFGNVNSTGLLFPASDPAMSLKVDVNGADTASAGVTLGNAYANYYTQSHSRWIVVGLMNPAGGDASNTYAEDELDLSGGWANYLGMEQGEEGWWEGNVVGQDYYIRFTATDLPDGCIISQIAVRWVHYHEDACQLLLSKESVYAAKSATGGTPLHSGILEPGADHTTGAGNWDESTSIFNATDLDASEAVRTIDNSHEYLAFRFTSQASASQPWQIKPVVTMEITHNTASKWPVVD